MLHLSLCQLLLLFYKFAYRNNIEKASYIDCEIIELKLNSTSMYLLFPVLWTNMTNRSLEMKKLKSNLRTMFEGVNG